MKKIYMGGKMMKKIIALILCVAMCVPVLTYTSEAAANVTGTYNGDSYDDSLWEEITGDFTKYNQYQTQDGRLSNLYKVIQNLKDGDSLNVAYLGGSITVGSNAVDISTSSWRAIVGNRITEIVQAAHMGSNVVKREIYAIDNYNDEFQPKIANQITVNNVMSAYGATSSWFGAYRVNDDLGLADPDKVPDVAFVEFAYNDMCAGDVGASRSYTDKNGNTALACAADFESIILQLYKANPKCEIIGVFTTGIGYYEKIDFDSYPSLSAERAVLRNYNIPYIYVGREMVLKIMSDYSISNSSTLQRQSGNAWLTSGYFSDEVHPTDKGHKYYGDLINDYLEARLAAASSYTGADAVHNYSEYVNRTNGHTTYFDSSVLKLNKEQRRVGDMYSEYFGNPDYITEWTMSNWTNSDSKLHYSEFNRSLSTSEEGSEFAFRFTGTGVGFWCSTAYETGGSLNASVYLVDTNGKTDTVPYKTSTFSCTGANHNILPRAWRVMDNAPEATYEVRISSSIDEGKNCTIRRVFVDGGNSTPNLTVAKLPNANNNPELVINGGFENGTDGWTVLSAVDFWGGDDFHFAGEKALEMASNVAGVSTTVALEAGKDYKLSLYKKYNGGKVKLTLDGIDLVNETLTQNNRYSWENFSFDFTAPTTGNATLTLSTIGTSDNAFFDVVSIKEIAVPIQEPDTQLILDSGFENGFTTSDNGWEKIEPSDATISETVSFDGSKSLYLQRWSQGATTQFNIIKGKTYTLSFYHKGNAGATVEVYTVWGAADVLARQTLSQDDDFTMYTYTFVAKTTGTATVYLDNSTNGSEGESYFDNVKVYCSKKFAVDTAKDPTKTVKAILSNDQFKAGETVTVNVNTPSGYFVPAGSVYMTKNTSTKPLEIEKKDGKFTFSMPNVPICVYVSAFPFDNTSPVSTFGSSIKIPTGTSANAASGIQFGTIVARAINEGGIDYALSKRGTIILKSKDLESTGLNAEEWYNTLKNTTTASVGYCKGYNKVSSSLQDKNDDYIQYSARLYNITEKDAADYTFTAYGYAVYSADGHSDIVKISSTFVSRRYNQNKVYNSVIGKVTRDTFTLPTTADSAKDYIDSLNNALGAITPEALENGVGVIAEKMKQDVLNAPDTVASTTGVTYYVSTSGNTSNNGRSESSPWNLAKLNSSYSSLNSGDAVLFKRGDTFRATSLDSYMFSAKSGVSYGAYGSGAKPLFNGSVKNWADSSYWTATATPNVYKSSQTFSNFSTIVLNYTGTVGNTDENVAKRKINGYDGFNSYTDLNEDCSFYHDLSSGYIYFYSTSGNPGSRFSSIEIGGSKSIIHNYGAKAIENMSFVLGGFGISDDGITSNVVVNVKGCVFGYIGGQIFDEGTGVVAGNAVEVYGECNSFDVENCYMYQICDTAITHQDWDNGGSTAQNIKISGNIIEKCFWGIEFNNIGGTVKDFEHSYNVILDTGYGFGVTKTPRRDQYPSPYTAFPSNAISNGVCKNNIFYRSSAFIYNWGSKNGLTNVAYRNNINIQDNSKALGYSLADNVSYDLNDGNILVIENAMSGNSNTYLLRVTE